MRGQEGSPSIRPDHKGKNMNATTAPAHPSTANEKENDETILDELETRFSDTIA